MAQHCQPAVDWQTQCEKLRERGKQLLQSGRWSDCKFIVGTEPHQKEFEGHRLILAMASPVFEAMFFGGVPENNGPIYIHDVHPDGFKALLEYIYCDDVNLTSFDQACELCYVAKKYMLPHLVKSCTDHIWQDIRSDNACRAYEFAKLFDEEGLLTASLKVICNETSAVLSEPSFEDIDQSTLAVILQQDILKIESEMELFQAVERWAKRACARRGSPEADAKAMREVLGDLIGQIRYLTMTALEFAEGPAVCDLLTKEEALAIFVNLSSPEGGKRCPMPEKFVTTTTKRKIETVSAGYNSCLRCTQFSPHNRMENSSSIDCTVVFTVNRRVKIVGLQVPTQIFDFSLSHSSKLIHRQEDPPMYSELLYAHLLDPRGSRLTYTHFTSRVAFNSTIDICFNHIVTVEPHCEYRIGVVLNKPGSYPMMLPVTEAKCTNGVTFKFPPTGTRDGIFSAILYS